MKKITLRELLNTIINENYYIFVDKLTDYPLCRRAFLGEIEVLDCYAAFADLEIKSMTLNTKNECPMLYITLNYPSNFKEQLDQIEKRTQLSFEDMLKED